MRRFHGTVDGGLVAHWAAFCVGFVEGFRADHDGSCAAVLDAPDVTLALEALGSLQERATLEVLATALNREGHVHPATLATLLADARDDVAANLSAGEVRTADDGRGLTTGFVAAAQTVTARAAEPEVERGGTLPPTARGCAPAPARRPLLPSERRAGAVGSERRNGRPPGADAAGGPPSHELLDGPFVSPSGKLDGAANLASSLGGGGVVRDTGWVGEGPSSNGHLGEESSSCGLPTDISFSNLHLRKQLEREQRLRWSALD